MKRREFLALTAAAGACSSDPIPPDPEPEFPRFLKGYEELYAADPRAAALKWFTDADFGLFLHYGVYSQLKRGEWAQLRERIPVAEYAKLKDTFDPGNFDAAGIADLAAAAGMKYVNLTARHHDGFCLFRTIETDFNSLDACGRDLVGELAEACRARGLGLFLYYSYALDWRHPCFYSRETARLDWPHARPDYAEAQPEYEFEKDEDFLHYIKFVHAQLKELIYRYRPLAGVWLDPIMGFYARPELFPIEQTYAIVREAQPGILICFKQGANGGEDFTAPEREPRAHPRGGRIAAAVWERNKNKPIEICDTLQPRAWGYDERNDGEHRNAGDVMAMLEHCKRYDANLLLNTGPLPDGSIHPADERTLREVGRRLQAARGG